MGEGHSVGGGGEWVLLTLCRVLGGTLGSRSRGGFHFWWGGERAPMGGGHPYHLGLGAEKHP